MLTITRRFSFEASHQLPYHTGKCHNLHGHSYKMEVTITRQSALEAVKEKGQFDSGMVMDFGDLKAIVHTEIIEVLDHTHLNDFIENPTAERLTGRIFAILKDRLVEFNVDLVSVRLWETEGCYAEVVNNNYQYRVV